MRIGIDISLLSFPRVTGVGQYASGVVEALTRLYPEDHFHLLAVIPRRASINPKVYPWLKRPNCHLHIRRVPQRFMNLFQRLPLPIELLTGTLPDIIHHFDWHVYPTFAPLTTSVYDLTPLYEPQWHTYEQVAAFRRWFTVLSHHAVHFFPISKATQCALIRAYPDAGAVSTVAYPAARHISVNHSKPTIDKPYIVAVGTVEPRKNYPALISAFSQFNQKHPEYSLAIAGNPGWDTDAVKLISQTKKVRYLKFIDDRMLPQLYRNALAVVYPSLAEGFGLPVVEALASGGVVITSNQSSLTEAGGSAALYSDPYRFETITEQLERVYQWSPTRRAEQVKVGRKHAASFSYDHTAAVMRNTWEKVCG